MEVKEKTGRQIEVKNRSRKRRKRRKRRKKGEAGRNRATVITINVVRYLEGAGRHARPQEQMCVVIYERTPLVRGGG